MEEHRLLEGIRRIGLTAAEAAALAILLAGSVALTVVVWQTRGAVGGDAPDPLVVQSDDASEGADPHESAGGQASQAPSPTPAVVVVDVAGLVARPGLVTLPAGARVADAIAAAGGPRPGADTTPLNLARVLADGEQVVVTDGTPPPPPPPGPSDPAAATAGGRLDLNLSDAMALQQLPGIGPVTAQRIVDHRDSIGGFTDVIQLLEVPGIGPARFAELEPLVTV